MGSKGGNGLVPVGMPSPQQMMPGFGGGAQGQHGLILGGNLQINMMG